MKQTIKNTIAATIIALAATSTATAQYVTKILPAYNATANEQKVTLEHSGPKSFGFLELQGSEANLENFYGEAGFQPVTHKGIGLRGEVNFGSNYKDLVRPQVTYTPNLEDAFVQLRFSPTNTARKEQQFNVVAAKQFGSVNVNGFVDFTHYNGDWSRVSDVNISKKLTDNLSVFARQEYRPWTQKEHAYLIGLEAKL